MRMIGNVDDSSDEDFDLDEYGDDEEEEDTTESLAKTWRLEEADVKAIVRLKTLGVIPQFYNPRKHRLVNLERKEKLVQNFRPIRSGMQLPDARDRTWINASLVIKHLRAHEMHDYGHPNNDGRTAFFNSDGSLERVEDFVETLENFQKGNLRYEDAMNDWNLFIIKNTILR